MAFGKKIQNLLLIFPAAQHSSKIAGQVYSPPLGISYLSASVRNICEVHILDLSIEGYGIQRYFKNSDLSFYGLEPQKIISYLDLYKPDLVGFSCLFSGQIRDILEMCRIIKDYNPEIMTLIGGTHPSFLARELLEKEPCVDIISIGESEETLRNLILSSHKEGYNPDGICFRDKDKIHYFPKTRFISQLDDLPFPARDLLPIEKYFSIGRPINSIVMGSKPTSNRVLSMITSRGCPFRCKFCSSTKYWGNQYRFRSAENVLKEILFLKEKYNIGEVQFIDDNLTINRERAKKLFLGMIEHKINIKWCTPNGIQVATLDPELLELMKESGCYELNLAIESGVQEVLDNIIQKPLKLKDVPPVISKAKSLGIRLNAFFMIGLPGETKEQILATLRYARNSGIDYPVLFKTNPLVGSDVYDLCLEKGYISSSYNFTNNDFFRARYNSDQFKKEWLDKLASRHFLWIYARMLLKDPRRFFRYFLPIFLHTPFRLIRFIINKLVKCL